MDEHDSDGIDSEHGGDEVTRLLAHNIRHELRCQVALDPDLALTDVQCDHLTWAIVTGITYGFDFRWSPDWVKPGQPHTWSEDGEAFARCTDCLAVSPPSADEDLACAWHDVHRTEAHSAPGAEE